MSDETNKINITPFCPNLGGIISGINLAEGITDDQLTIVREAFLKYQVVFFQNQNEIPPEVQIEIGKKFGELHSHPAAPTMKGYPEIFEIHAHKNSKIANGEFWHSDVSCDETPPLGTMLQIHILPESGGDTMFCNMYQAYESLSDTYKEFLDKLFAVHESEHLYKGRYAERGVDDGEISFPASVHPIVRTHPETKRKALFINRTFTKRIEGLALSESEHTLNFLFNHCEQLDFQIRYKWNMHDMVFWDNRCTMHRAIWDYWPMERKGRRVTIKGEKPS